MTSSQMDSHISIKKSTCVWGDSLFIFVVGRFVQLPQNIKTRIPLHAISIVRRTKNVCKFFWKVSPHASKTFGFCPFMKVCPLLYATDVLSLITLGNCITITCFILQ